jgi:hypothetical protein
VERFLVLGLLLVVSGCGSEPADGSPHDGSHEDEDASTDEQADSGMPRDAASEGRDAADDPELDAASGDAAGSDAAPADTDPPLLVASTPEDGDDNVASGVTVELIFSEAVTLTAGAVQVRQAQPARALAVDVSLREGGQSIALELDEVPDLPAELTIELGAGIRDLAGNPLAPTAVHFTVPAWLRLGASANRDARVSASDVSLAWDHQGRPLLLAVEDGAVYASRWDGGAWQQLGGALNQQPALQSAGAGPRIALATDAGENPIAAFRESSGVVVVRWDGASWQSLGDPVDPQGGGSYAPALALDGSDRPVIAFDALDASAQPVLRVRALVGTSWQTLEEIAAETNGVRFASDSQNDLAIAYQQSGSGVFVLRWDGGAFVPLGAGHALAESAGGFALGKGTADGCALSAQGLGTVRLQAGAWQALPRDLGFADSSAALDRALAIAPDGALLAAFSETPAGESAARVYAQRLEGTRFQPLGPPLNRDRRASASRPALALTAGGAPLVAFLETPAAGGPAQIFVSLFNGDPARPPTGLRERAHSAGCLASAPPDGARLIETGCFADEAARQPVAGFIPFDVVAPLWSDGAFKRRFFMLPEGESIAYRDPGIWTFPEGTILIKEFAIEGRRGDPSTIRPVETRFLVVREGGDWDRYSYQWDQDASDAVLRPAAPATPLVDFAIEDEGGNAAVQTHFYPSRAQCLSCHQAPGTVLGPQTAMLNRNFDYGITVDNQLRSMQQLGLFDSGSGPSALAQMRFMPNPSDTTHRTEARLRAYLHANCSGCHHPLEGLDLRIETPTLDSGLCTKLTTGDLDGSVVYWRAVRRGNVGQPGVAPMPPLGTLVPNPELEVLLTDFILDPQNPCP